MYDKCCTLVYQPHEEGHEEGAPPSVASLGPMAVPTFSNKLPLAMKRGRNRRPGTISSSTAGSRVLKLELHAEEEDSVSEVSDGNGVEDVGPIQLLITNIRNSNNLNKF